MTRLTGGTVVKGDEVVADSVGDNNTRTACRGDGDGGGGGVTAGPGQGESAHFSAYRRTTQCLLYGNYTIYRVPKTRKLYIYCVRVCIHTQNAINNNNIPFVVVVVVEPTIYCVMVER